MDNSSKPRCAICGHDDVIFVGRPQISAAAAKFIRHEYKVALCRSCRFYSVFPRIDLTQEEWGELYGEEYFTENPPWWDRKRAEHRTKRLELLDRYSDLEIRRFLDIGCGEGYVLADAAGKGWDAFGMDIYDNRKDNARTGNISFFKGNIFEAAYPDNYFDSVYLDSVLEHLIDPVSHLREIHRIMRRGGTLYAGVPNENSLFNDFRKIAFTIMGRREISVRTKPFKTPYHVVGFTEKSLRKILGGCDFDIPRLSIFGGEYEWLKFKVLSRGFLINSAVLPINLLAIPLRKQIYMDVIARKT